MSAKWRRSRAWDDRVFPPVLWPLKSVLRALSSIWLAVVTLGLIAVYAAAGSAPFVPLRSGDGLRWVHAWESLGWTSAEYYAAWPLIALLALFVVNMIVATIRRIEFRWINAGVLTVHAGIVLLATGAAIDSTSRERGELFLKAGTPLEWVDRFTVPGEIELSVEVAGDRASLPLRGLPRYRGESHDEGDPFARWAPPISGAPEQSVLAYAPRARVRDTWARVESGGVAAWTLNWHGTGAEEWSGVLAATSGPETVFRLPDGTRLAHLGDADDEAWAVASAPTPGDSNAFLAITADEECRLVPVWPGARLRDEQSGASITVVSIERFSVVPSSLEQGRDPVVSPALIATVRLGQGPERTVVLLADAPRSSYEIVETLRDPPAVVPLATDPTLAKLAFIDTATPAVTLRGLEAVVRAPGGAIEGPMPIAPGGRLRLGGDSELRFEAFAEHVRPVRVLEPLSRDSLPAEAVGSRLHAAVLVRSEGGAPAVWLPVTRWGTETESLPLEDGRTTSVGVSLASHRLPMAQLALQRVDQPSSGNAVARVLRRRSPDEPSAAATISLNEPLRWVAPREAASSASRLLDAIAPVHWQAAVASWDEEAPTHADGGRFVLLSINSSAGTELIAAGGVMILLGSPVALLLKPWVVRRGAAGEAA